MKPSLKHAISFAAFFLPAIFSFGQHDLSKQWMIRFSGYQSKLSKEARATIDCVAAMMQEQPDINYVVTCYCLSCKNSRYNATRWERINNVMIYLVEKKRISPDRLSGRYGEEAGDCDTIDFFITHERDNALAPPPPNIRKKADQLSCAPDSSSNY
jgi:hypothetical protein